MNANSPVAKAWHVHEGGSRHRSGISMAGFQPAISRDTDGGKGWVNVRRRLK